jgi:trehalose synthase
MRKLLLSFIPAFIFAQTELQSESMLCKADWISKTFNIETSKTAPPLYSPQPQKCLDTASVWFSVDLDQLKGDPFEMLSKEILWDRLKEIGVEAVYLKGLKTGGEYRTAIDIDPKWGDLWNQFAMTLQKKAVALIGDSIGNSTGIGPDFLLALKNVGDYPGLYHLIEIDHRDWNLLPKVPSQTVSKNIPWLSLQSLQKKGYVPLQYSPYTKQSNWNATGAVKCSDGNVRRWIYLKENVNDPVIDWLNPTFAGCRIAAADALDSIYRIGEKIIRINPTISNNAKETLALWARKLGAFSVVRCQNGLDEMKTACADLFIDTLTRSALLHALIAQDTEVLKLMYRLLLDEGIETKRLVHELQPLDQFSCDWSEFVLHPKRKYQYYDEILTGELLRQRLLKSNLGQIDPKFSMSLVQYCANALGYQDFNRYKDDIASAHLLLAFFYCMQPGAFSFSVSDLLGTITHEKVNLLTTNDSTLYPSLAGQFKNPNSFAMQLKKILSVRREYDLANAELVGVPQTNQPELLILVHRLKIGSKLQILAVNFGENPASQTLEIPSIRNTTAINLMTGLIEKKPLGSSTIKIDVPALSGKVILFQPKYYD